MPLLSPGLIHYYNDLWGTLRPAAGERQARLVIEHHHRYVGVQRASGVPWYVVGILHSLECNFSSQGHLHNGDPLDRPTLNAPAGRGPFRSWEESAIDALHLKRRMWASITWTAIHEHLLALEIYNGLGYLLSHPEVNSPYLWGMTNHHSRGKYVSDGRFDPEAETRQVGAAAILYWLLELYPSLMPAITVWEPDRSGPVTGPDAGRWEVSRLQAYLNSLPGPRIAVDGRWGPQTAARYEAVFRVAA